MLLQGIIVLRGQEAVYLQDRCAAFYPHQAAQVYVYVRRYASGFHEMVENIDGNVERRVLVKLNVPYGLHSLVEIDGYIDVETPLRKRQVTDSAGLDCDIPAGGRE